MHHISQLLPKSSQRPNNSNKNSSDRPKNDAEIERLYCEVTCKGLLHCQYSNIGNTGCKPDWAQWNPRYEFVKQCHYRLAWQAELKSKRFFRESNLPQKYTGLTLQDIKITNNNAAAVKSLMQLVNGEKSLVYITLQFGKTKLLAATGGSFIQAGMQVVYTTANEIATQLRFNNPDYYKILDHITNAQVLLIDDFGEERPVEYNLEQWNLIIERRNNIGQTAISSSITAEQALNRYPFDITQLKHRLSTYN